ncbi:MAG: hypothetical protein ACFFD4_30915 [Candidatus Odinarchaeota archaeon]
MLSRLTAEEIELLEKERIPLSNYLLPFVKVVEPWLRAITRGKPVTATQAVVTEVERVVAEINSNKYSKEQLLDKLDVSGIPVDELSFSISYGLKFNANWRRILALAVNVSTKTKQFYDKAIEELKAEYEKTENISLFLKVLFDAREDSHFTPQKENWSSINVQLLPDFPVPIMAKNLGKSWEEYKQDIFQGCIEIFIKDLETNQLDLTAVSDVLTEYKEFLKKISLNADFHTSPLFYHSPELLTFLAVFSPDCLRKYGAMVSCTGDTLRGSVSHESLDSLEKSGYATKPDFSLYFPDSEVSHPPVELHWELVLHQPANKSSEAWKNVINSQPFQEWLEQHYNLKEKAGSIPETEKSQYYLKHYLKNHRSPFWQEKLEAVTRTYLNAIRHLDSGKIEEDEIYVFRLWINGPMLLTDRSTDELIDTNPDIFPFDRPYSPDDVVSVTGKSPLYFIRNSFIKSRFQQYTIVRGRFLQEFVQLSFEDGAENLVEKMADIRQLLENDPSIGNAKVIQDECFSMIVPGEEREQFEEAIEKFIDKEKRLLQISDLVWPIISSADFYQKLDNWEELISDLTKELEMLRNTVDTLMLSGYEEIDLRIVTDILVEEYKKHRTAEMPWESMLEHLARFLKARESNKKIEEITGVSETRKNAVRSRLNLVFQELEKGKLPHVSIRKEQGKSGGQPKRFFTFTP